MTFCMRSAMTEARVIGRQDDHYSYSLSMRLLVIANHRTHQRTWHTQACLTCEVRCGTQGATACIPSTAILTATVRSRQVITGEFSDAVHHCGLYVIGVETTALNGPDRRYWPDGQIPRSKASSTSCRHPRTLSMTYIFERGRRTSDNFQAAFVLAQIRS